MIIILMGMSELTLAQKQNNIWYFGMNAGLDFSTTPPIALVSEMDADEGSASISDTNGQLLFYSNGLDIWDRNHNIMPNGSGLAGGLSSTQAALIVPLPGSFTQYYLFTTDDKPDGSLSYSIVDISLNGGLGDIVNASKNTLLQNQTGEKVAAVMHANGVDIWVITHRLNSNEFLTFLLTSSGINTNPVISSVGSVHASDAQIGPLKVSRDRSKIACSAISSTTFPPVLELFDFNSCTGQLSNAQYLNNWTNKELFIYGIEFSPSGELLYLSSRNYLYQLDLLSHQWTILLYDLFFNFYHGALQLGPDNKIYFTRQDLRSLDVIHFPDRFGSLCQFEEEEISLAPDTRAVLGLPNPVPYSFAPDSNLIISLGNDTTICTGTSLVLNVDHSSNCAAISFLWNDGSTGSELIVNQPGVYWVEVECPCASFRDSIQIETKKCQQDCGNLGSTVYGSNEVSERGYCLVATPDNDGFYIGGYRDGNVAITKMSLSGYVYWSRTFDIVPDKVEHVNSMLIDSEGMLAISGTSGSTSSSSSFVFRYDPDLNLVLWSKVYAGAPDVDNFSIIEKGKTGNYLLSNYVNLGDLTKGSQILELDKENGIIQSSALINLGESNSINRTVDMIYEGDFIYGAGMFSTFELSSEWRNLLVKVNGDNFNIEWSKLGHYSLDTFANLKGCDLIMVNNEIYSCYYGRSPGSLKDKIYIQKTDLNGNLIWLKQYDITKPTIIGFEIINSNNGIVVFGTQLSNLNELVLFKVDYNGEVLWARKFRSGLFSREILLNMDARSSQLIEVGDQLIFTTYTTDSLGKDNLVLIKTNLNGESVSPCIENLVLEFPWRIVNDPLFYPLDLLSDAMDIKEVTLFSQGVDVELNLLESCAISDNIYSIVETTICNGEVFEGYDTSDTYVDTFQLSSGCDSIRTLRLSVISCEEIVHYDLDACRSYMDDGSHMDYTEFTPAYPTVLTCADVSAGFLFRDFPQKHSCTPGIEGSPAMCVTTLNSCTYVPGNEASIVIEVMVNPSVDSVFRLTGLEFYEKSPATFNWIDGDSGPNNYPRFYGLRILKNGIEIFRQINIQTATNWTLQSFDFIVHDSFRVGENTIFRIELLPYCPVGNGALVSAWDVDEFKIYGGCIPFQDKKPMILGQVHTRIGQEIPNIRMILSDDPSFVAFHDNMTDDTGQYLFKELSANQSYYLKGYKNDDVLNGVSTLDMIHIQKHLLGKELFTSLHQYIAADVNHSGHVSVVDLLDLRKLLLGKYTEFPRNTSWRFGHLPQDFNGVDPNTLEEIKTIETLSNDTQTVNFVGIKIGDLNDDVELDVDAPKIDGRNSNSMTLRVEDIPIKAGESFSVDITAGDYLMMAGMQFSMQLKHIWNVEVRSGTIPVSGQHFSMSDERVFRFSWSTDEDIKVLGNDVLFTITMTSDETGLLSDKIEVLKTGLKAEAYAADELEIVPLEFEFRKHDQKLSENGYLRIEPNPVHNNAQIRFNIVNSGQAIIRFYDASGRLLYSIDKAYSAGEHLEQVSIDQFHSGKGIIYCQLISNGYTNVQKFVIMN